jgi:hypothetical protein
MRKRIFKLWTTASILSGVAVFIAVTPPSKAACIMLALILSVLAYWLYDAGMDLYEHYKAMHPRRVKAWIR